MQAPASFLPSVLLLVELPQRCLQLQLAKEAMMVRAQLYLLRVGGQNLTATWRVPATAPARGLLRSLA